MNGIKALDAIAPLALDCVSRGLDYQEDYLVYAQEKGIEPLSQAKYEQVERIFDRDVKRYFTAQRFKTKLN